MPEGAKRVDVHVHVGVLGDRFPEWGRISEWMQGQTSYKIFLKCVGIDPDDVCDDTLREAAVRTIRESKLDRVVCLALDPVYDEAGVRREDRAHMWVDNEYVIDLRRDLGERVLLGASIHPYDPAFTERLRKYAKDAVLMKWLPSAQQIDLADDRVLAALRAMATAGRDGRPIPLLLHVGPEYAIVTSDPRTTSYDFLSWSKWDRFWNSLRPKKRRWRTPNVKKIGDNLRAALDAGASIIFAHCGLPYFTPKWLAGWSEHSELGAVQNYLSDYQGAGGIAGKCFTDVSACVTPIRKTFFSDIAGLPAGSVLVGSDFPVPLFELSADAEERKSDLKAAFQGDLQRLVLPQGNLLDVNWDELQKAFPGHAMFENAQQLFGS